jgi:hypothetical protein
MSLNQWADNGWLKPYRTSRKEINSLLNFVKRDLNDAQRDVRIALLFLSMVQKLVGDSPRSWDCFL